jgi:hypothetical protein
MELARLIRVEISSASRARRSTQVCGVSSDEELT